MNSFVGSVLKTAADIIIFAVLIVFALIRDLVKLFYNDKKRLTGKLALVTGAGSGIGRSVAFKLSKLGCRIAVVDIDGETAKAAAEQIKAKGGDARDFKTDISILDSVLKLRDDVASRMGPVDILVNNAGLIPDMSLDEQPPGFNEKMVKVNLLGTYWVTETFLAQMKENNSGHIVAISSMTALHPSPFTAFCSATKAGLSAYMTALQEKLRLERWSGKIKTTTICPHYVKTKPDIVEFLSHTIRCAPLETEEAAESIVNAVLREDSFVTIPSHYKPLLKIMNLCSVRMQQLVRDYVLREFEFKRSG